LSLLDIIFGIIILIGAYKGYKDGFLVAVFTLLAIILGVIGGFMLLGNAMIMLGYHFQINESFLPFVAFAVVFVIIVIVVSLIGKIVKSSLSITFLGKVDQAMGGLMGLVKTTFLISISLWIINAAGDDPLKNLHKNSYLYSMIEGFAPNLTSMIAKLIPSVGDIFK
jgi:membrane protein required for colicin V production